MNVVKEIQAINAKELDMGISGSWHDQYKDSAYIFVGGLHFDMTEGDVITIFSQYGEIMDINMPRDKEKGKPRGFAFLMYEDQRSTILAVDNLNGARVLEKTLRVDHVNNYKQKGKKNQDGQWEEPEEQSLNARPEIARDVNADDDDGSMSSVPSIDPEDPMRDYLLAKRREEKGKSKLKKSKKHEGETPDERQARKERKKAKKEAKSKPQPRRDRDERDLPRSSRHTDDSERVRERTRSRSPPTRSHRDTDELERRRRDYGTR
ncbi:hypothetical protein FRB96_000029 [Tulasnella sp. 330]|nr:hypothetical protein FRB96_000029 [Tulasnella sp. 330]KAG8882627.1 hypothetical protein FRB97_007973 [Tulasnella sp. 331]KAG8890497.1 hypothetical protein FRB98_007844 [Tulasnella sp. 332]